MPALKGCTSGLVLINSIFNRLQGSSFFSAFHFLMLKLHHCALYHHLYELTDHHLFPRATHGTSHGTPFVVHGESPRKPPIASTVLTQHADPCVFCFLTCICFRRTSSCLTVKSRVLRSCHLGKPLDEDILVHALCILNHGEKQPWQ